VKDEIRIKLSVGLIAVAVIHAVLLGGVFTALHQRPAPQKQTDWSLPSSPPTTPEVGRIEKLEIPPTVNLPAQAEMKQQIFRRRCNPCQPTVVQPSYSVPTVTVQPATPSVPIVVTPTKPIATPKSEKKSYQLALFIGSDAKSKRLLDWFNKDPKLIKFKSSCEFQVYTSSNALYRTRYQEIVPVSQFPVVLFQDSTGGHVHAAGHTMLPETAAELYSDLQHSFGLYEQTREAQQTGAIRERGYSWDDAISPTMQLSSEDCPDGYCPVEPSDRWRPFDRDNDRDRLFDRDSDGRNALIWAGAGELATLALIVVAIILLGFILIKRGM